MKVYLSARLFHHFQGLIDQISQILLLPLGIVDFVSDVYVGVFEEVENREDLPVIGHEGFTYHLAWLQ